MKQAGERSKGPLSACPVTACFGSQRPSSGPYKVRGPWHIPEWVRRLLLSILSLATPRGVIVIPKGVMANLHWIMGAPKGVRPPRVLATPKEVWPTRSKEPTGTPKESSQSQERGEPI
jgi:hypothetical protein